MRPGRRCRIALLSVLALVGLALVVGSLQAARAVLFPRVDSPARVDVIVVVAGAKDERYDHALGLAESGGADRILVSQPGGTGEYAELITDYCAGSPVTAPDGRRITIECFAPDIDTPEGETTAATRIAREQGAQSLLVVTYWGHVSRARMYFEQCFDREVFVTDTPRPLSRSCKDALLHESGGYLKAFFTPAC